MIERFQHDWRTKLASSNRFSVYRMFKSYHLVENYVNDVTIESFRDCIIILRFGINKRYMFQKAVFVEIVLLVKAT